MKFMSFLILSGSLLLSLSCDTSIEEEEEVTMNEPTIGFNLVEEELIPYFQRFEEEAERLGLEVNLTAANIGGIIREIEEANVAGRCTLKANGEKYITVDKTYWERSSDLFKEFIIFHELGHCYLLRGHLEDSFASGFCVSIMRSGVGDCSDGYTSRTRDYYIEELFFPSDGSPNLITNSRIAHKTGTVTCSHDELSF